MLLKIINVFLITQIYVYGMLIAIQKNTTDYCFNIARFYTDLI